MNLPFRITHRRLAALVALLLCLPPTTAFPAADKATSEIGGFEIPKPGRKFTFPRDHGSHPEFSIEWWYLTGHLRTQAGGPFGFQATFFRRSTSPSHSSTNAPRSAAFGHQQLFLAHMAFVDVSAQRFYHQERLNREGWDAYATTNTLDVRNGNWTLHLSDHGATPTLLLRGSCCAEIAFELSLHPLKPLVAFGTNGVSRKAAEPSAASHYLTFPRLRAQGTVAIRGAQSAVTGEAWMDHEFSSSQLGEGQVGWDWASIQLQDGRELMAYRMRRNDGTTDPFSTLAWIQPSGEIQHLNANQFSWEVLSRWKSPTSGAEYPSRLRLNTVDPASGKPFSVVLQPLVLDQELRGDIGGIAYWEGACRVENTSGQPIGNAYLELTGYAGTLKGKF